MLETTRSMTLAAFLGDDELASLRALAAKETEPPLLAQQASVLAMFGDDKPARAAMPKLTAAAKDNPTLATPARVARAYVLAGDRKFDEALTEHPDVHRHEPARAGSATLSPAISTSVLGVSTRPSPSTATSSRQGCSSDRIP